MIETAVAAGGLIVAAILSSRLFSGPTFYDRAMAAFSVNGLLALAVAAVGVMTGRLALVDLAITQVGAGFILALATLKILRLRSLQPALDTVPPEPPAKEASPHDR